MLKVMVSPVKAHAMATCLWMSGLLDFIYGPEKAAKSRLKIQITKFPLIHFYIQLDRLKEAANLEVVSGWGRQSKTARL